MALQSKYMISPNLQEFFIDSATNLPLSGGFVYYYSDVNRSSLKTVYQLTGTFGSYAYTALPNPVQLGGAGTPINGSGADIRVYYYPYDITGQIENYYINVTDSLGNNKLQRQAWPNVVSGNNAATTFAYNFARNPNFYSWSNGTTGFANVGVGSNSVNDFMMDDWTYSQSDSTQSIAITQGVFDPGEVVPDGNPTFYVVYYNTGTGSAAQTYNRFTQTYQGVQTLSGQDVAISIWLNQPLGTVGQFSVDLTQYFGSGGSTSVVTTVIPNTPLVSGTWREFTGSVTLPSIVSKTVGTGNALYLNVNLPLNLLCKIYMGPVIYNQGLFVSGNQEISNDDIQKQTNALGLYPAFTTGDIKFTLKTSAPVGWLLMDNTTIGAPGSGATHVGFNYFNLYQLLWNGVSDTYAPVSTGRSGSALNDWNLGKNIGITYALGRALAGAGTPYVGGTNWAIGQTHGAETISLGGANMPAHAHGAGSLTVVIPTYPAGAGTGQVAGTNSSPVTNVTVGVTGSTDSQGSGTAFEIISPTVHYNVMIKL